MIFKEIKPSDDVISSLLSLSLEWEREDITYGYKRNEKDDVVGNKIFIAEDNGKIVGYLFGKMKMSNNMSSVIPDETPIFVVEELYVKSSLRSQGVGKKLFQFAEKEIRNSGAEYLFLNTATKNYKSILHFYIDEVGMDFCSASLFKKLP